MQPLTLETLRAFLLEEGRGEALCLAPNPAWDEGEEHYFCTPLGAKIIGSAGVDGIHFCLAPGRETVYAVSPMNGEGERVHPVARNLKDFVRLLLACGSTAAIEQAWQWDKETFIRFVEEDQPGAEGRAALEALARAFSLGRMEDPYDYMAKAREGFSESDLTYPAEEGPEETEPAQADAPFPRAYGQGAQYPPACAPIPFRWGGEEGRVVGYGVVDGWFVADVAIRRSPDTVRQMLAAHSRDWLEVSVCLQPASGCPKEQRGAEAGYYPGFPRSDGEWKSLLRVGQAVLHYGLDASRCWEIQRAGFRWQEGCSGPVTLTVTHDPYWIEAARFTVSGPGQAFTLPHPGGGELRLTVTEFAPMMLEETCLPSAAPRCLWRMGYTLSPDPGKGKIWLRDISPDDRYPGDGPTAVIVRGIGAGHTAVSARHFDLPGEVTWSCQFQRQDPEKAEIPLPVLFNEE